MTITRTLSLAAAALLLAGASHFARAADGDTHVLNVRLPNGVIEQIQYTGDVPPQVVLTPDASFAANPFAMLQRMSALMDMQAAAMFQVMGAPGFGLTPAGFGALPAGQGVCTQSMQITFTGNGQDPHVVRSTSGDCGNGSTAPAAVSAAPIQPAVKTIQVKADGDRPVLAMVHPIAAWQR